MKQRFTVTGMTRGLCEKTWVRALRQRDCMQLRVKVDSVQPREALTPAIADDGYTVAV